ncbi:MAG TPA: flagellar biosynthetic protein FliQ [Anaeromyxobacteraceae bacterium]|nr:flagellar biosynthetic protein FliQ [Anaeromyxobacteraceae bacterium]
MDPTLLHLGREALVLVLLVSAPPLGAALLVGLVTGVLQAATQVQEPTVGVVPRLAAVLGALLLAGPWIGARVVRFAAQALELLPRIAP